MSRCPQNFLELRNFTQWHNFPKSRHISSSQLRSVNCNGVTVLYPRCCAILVFKELETKTTFILQSSYTSDVKNWSDHTFYIFLFNIKGDSVFTFQLRISFLQIFHFWLLFKEPPLFSPLPSSPLAPCTSQGYNQWLQCLCGHTFFFSQLKLQTMILLFPLIQLSL